MRHVTRVLLSACALVALLSGCGQKDQGSQVTIGIPSSFPSKAASRSYAGKGNSALMDSDDSISAKSVSASATAQPRLISVNISYGGVSVATPFVWKAASDTDVPPSEITFASVPAGNGRLIQVLVAVEDSATKAIMFYYGDSLKDITGKEVAADIVVSDIGAAQSSDVNISGRYLRADGTGPTGLMNVTFLPAEGKPEMFLFQEEIFAGWFNVFALESAKFRYAMENGEEIFPFTSGLSNGFYLADQPYRNMRVKVPAAWRPNYQSGSSSATREALDPQRLVVGFFGPGAGTANKAVCYSSTAEALTDVWQASTGSTAVYWSGATAPAASEAGVEAAGASNVQGGKALTSTMCAGDNSRQLYKDYLVFAHQEIRNRDKLLGFQGPFALKAEATRSFATTSWAANKVTLQWKYLPGIKESGAIEGVTVYSRVGYSNNNSDEFRDHQNDGLACDKIPNLTGIRKDGDIPVATETVDIANVESADWSAQKVQIALCPYRTAADNTRVYLKKGLYVYIYGSGGSTVASAAERVGIYSRSTTVTTAATRETINNNTCVPLRITAETATGLPAYFASGTQVALTSTDTNGRFFYDEQCSNPSGGQTAMSLNAPQNNEVYYKSTATGTLNFSINASASVAAVTAGTLFANLPSGSQTADKVIVVAQDQGYAQSCFPVTFQTVKSSTNAFANVTADASWNLSATGMQFFYPSDYGCTGGATSTFAVSFTPGRTSYRFNAKYVGATAATVNLTPVATSSEASGFAVGAKSIAFAIPGPANRLSLMMPMEVKAEECVEAMVRLTDSNYHEVSNTGNSMIVASLAATAGGAFYTSHTSCTANSAPISSVSLYSGYSASKIYYRNNTPGAATASVADGVAPTTYQGMTLNVTVAPPGINRIAVGIQGQNWDGTTKTFAGTPPLFKVGQTIVLELRALTASGNTVTDANLTMADINLHDANGTMTVLTTPTWSSGVANVSVKFNAAYNYATVISGGAPSMLVMQTSYGFPVLPTPSVIGIVSSTFNPGNCQPVMVSIQGNADNTSAVLQAPTTIAFNSSGGAMNFYSDAACTTDITSTGATMAVGSSAHVVFVSVTSGNPVFRATAAGLSDFGASPIAAGSAGNIQNLQIVGNSNFRPNACQAFMVIASDANGNAKTPGGVVTARLATSGTGLFYSTPDCSGGGTNTLDAQLGTSGVNLKAAVFYFQSSAQSSQSISATDVSGTPYCYSSSYCATASMTINPNFGP